VSRTRLELIEANMVPHCPCCGAEPGSPFTGKRTVLYDTVKHALTCPVLRFESAHALWKEADPA